MGSLCFRKHHVIDTLNVRLRHTNGRSGNPRIWQEKKNAYCAFIFFGLGSQIWVNFWFNRTWLLYIIKIRKDSHVYTTPVSCGPLCPFFGLFEFKKLGRIPRIFGGGSCTGWACADIGWDSTETSVNLISTLCCGSWVTLSVCGGGPFAKLSFARFRK